MTLQIIMLNRDMIVIEHVDVVGLALIQLQ